MVSKPLYIKGFLFCLVSFDFKLYQSDAVKAFLAENNIPYIDYDL